MFSVSSESLALQYFELQLLQLMLLLQSSLTDNEISKCPRKPAPENKKNKSSVTRIQEQNAEIGKTILGEDLNYSFTMLLDHQANFFCLKSTAN